MLKEIQKNHGCLGYDTFRCGDLYILKLNRIRSCSWNNCDDTYQE